MATMDIFEGDAFSIIELTRALENIPFKPATLSASGLFGDRGVRTRTVVIESRDGTLSLIPFSERGAPHDSQVPERRDVRAFVCRQFKKQDVIWASEIQGIRAFGTESEAQQVQVEVARRLRRLRTDAEATFEYHFLNGIQGIVKDPKDGATVVNYFTEFAITPAAEVDFDLDNASPASGALRKRCQALIESVEESMGGLATGAVQLRAECGSAFFADLVAHKEVRETYLNTAAANELRRRVVDEFSFGGITFRRYGGNATIGVPTDKAFFYPEGIEGLFEIYYAPADTFETVNTLGLPLYARAIPDRERDEWVRLEIESNPLPICTRPQVLRSARRT
jgi:Phage major capsid protein E